MQTIYYDFKKLSNSETILILYTLNKETKEFEMKFIHNPDAETLQNALRNYKHIDLFNPSNH